ncbi:MAG: putative metal-binding motif-containing protein [Myxococcota bacterium]
MAIVFRRFSWLCSAMVLFLLATHCTSVGISSSDLQICGEGFTKTSTGCQRTQNLCTPACPADEKCVDQKCVPRYPVSNGIDCVVPCGVGFVCNRDTGACVSAGKCPKPCGPGTSCVQGKCVLRATCNPPCPQIGFICDNGLCQKVCTPSCTNGEECISGVCQKKCNPACGKDSFCSEGRCVRRVDNDRDGYTNDRDCNDNDRNIFPGATERCNNKDNNCDGIVDNITPRTCYEGPANTIGKGTCAAGNTTCQNGQAVCTGQIIPNSERCDKQDNDCDGTTDEGCGN